MTLRWERGDAEVRWEFDGHEVIWASDEALRSAAFVAPSSIVVVASQEIFGVDNAFVLNLDGTERCRLIPPPKLRSPIGFDQVFQSRRGVVAIFATKDGDLHGVPNLDDGTLSGVAEWR